MRELPTVKYRIEFRGNTASVVSEDSELVFQCSDEDLIDRDSGVFAAWAVLPIAMTTQHNVVIEGCGDRTAERNAAQLSRIWSMWVPSKFVPVDLQFTERVDGVKRTKEDRDLLLFSGGVDSCYNLLRRHEAGHKQALLTIHGLDYKPNDAERFNDLIEKTEPIRALTKSARFSIQTNAYQQYKRVNLKSGFTHGFLLSACLFLAGRKFKAGEISADDTRFQEFLAFPWGTNSVTNEYFASSEYILKTGCLDVTRAEKVGKLIKSPEALASLSFCKTYSARPHNCGTCSKCVRTKLMFLMECGNVPDIFIDSRVDGKHLSAINLRNRNDYIIMLDLFDSGRRNNTLHLLPALEDKYRKISDPGIVEKLRNLFRK